MKAVVSIAAFAAFLMLLALTTLIVGLHDAALAGASFSVRLVGVVLVGVGVLLFVAACLLGYLSRSSRWEWGVVRPPCKPIVLVAFLLATLVGIYVFFAGIQTDGAQRIVVVSAALTLIGVPLAGLFYFGRDARVTLPRLGVIALGLIGTVIGAWQFWYQNQYLPSRAGRAVALEVKLHRVGVQKAHHVIRARVEYRAVGGRSVSVIGSTYTLTGSRVVRCHRFATTKVVQEVFKGFLIDPQRSRFMADVWENRPPSVLAAGKFAGDGKRLEPDVPSSREFIFLVPRHTYQLLRFRAQLFAIPGSVQLSQSSKPEYTNYKGDNALYGFWQVDDNSWLHELIYGRERWVIIRYELVDPSEPEGKATTPDLRVTARFPDPTWSEGKPTEAKVKGLFKDPQPSDASEPFAGTELAVEAVAEPNAGERKALPRCRR